MQVTEEFNQMFDALVPAQGKAGTLGGELLRATARLGYRYLNDGDMVGRDYGNETCSRQVHRRVRRPGHPHPWNHRLPLVLLRPRVRAADRGSCR